jgi:hypothetical protein
MARNQSTAPGPAQPSGNGPARVVARLGTPRSANATGPHGATRLTRRRSARATPLLIFAFGPHI